MQTVLFSVATLDQRQEILNLVRQTLKPDALERLYPDAGQPDTQREYFIALDDKRDVAAAARLLSGVPGVVAVDIPAPRKLIA